ncbi:MAG: hypothetical protein QOK15_3441, partial [Nocardioidaceae bacterium]|nr:hypothetical protein [Nocardioidaceae bacterium]
HQPAYATEYLPNGKLRITKRRRQ